jgi:DNA ligase (NAD+)
MGQSIEQRIAKLREEINHHSHLYYIEARPRISDRDFDRLMAELIELEKAHPERVEAGAPRGADDVDR